MRISDWSSDVCSSDLVAYDDAAELRHVDEALGVHREAEAAGAEAGAGMDLAGAADLAIGQRNVGADHRAVADDHRRPDHAVGLDPAAAADLGAGADHHARADLAALANDRAGVDNRRGVHARPRSRRWVEGLRHLRVAAIGPPGEQKLHAGRRALGKLRRDDAGAGLAFGELAEVAPDRKSPRLNSSH